MSYAPTPAVAIAPAIAPPLDNKLFKQFMKDYLKAQMQGRIAPEVDLESSKQLFKARVPDFYYNNLHMDYYQFCQ